MTDRARLVRLLGDPELAWLRDRVRRRLERDEPLDGTVTLADATGAQRRAANRLLGRRPRPGRTLSVSLPAVDEVLRRSGACPEGLAAAVISLTGEVTRRTTEAAERDRRWSEALAPLQVLAGEGAELADWCRRVVDIGLVRRLAGTPEAASALIARLAAVVGELPADGEALGGFAARVAGGAHALDDGQPLATLTLGAARALSGIADGSGAEWRREVWASVGLLRDEVSSTVLTLGLPGDGETATGQALAAWHRVGQPAVLTLRQVVRDPPRLDARTVSVCENPVVVSTAADRLGAGCAPLVCTSGQPSAAVLHLLRLLVQAGADLRYHGDFDWGGLRIAGALFDRLPIRPWRFTTADYRAATPSGRELTGSPTTAHWDDAIAAAMAAEGRAVEEEHVLDDLIADLRSTCQ